MTTSDSTPARKACTKCGVIKPLDLFYRAKKEKDGRKAECIECSKAYVAASKEKRRVQTKLYRETNKERLGARKREYYLKNREKLIAKATERNKSNPERRRLCSKTSARKLYQENPETPRRRSREWHSRNLETSRAKSKAWRDANPEKRAAAFHAYRARLIAAEGSHTAADIARLHDLQKGRCASCNSKLNGKWHVDHVIALSKGGPNDRYNLQLLCGHCNLSKWATDPIAFAQRQGRLL